MNLVIVIVNQYNISEYNSMQSRGYTRPLSVIQIRSEARRKYSSLGVKFMMEMLTPISEYLWSCSALYINRYAWKYYSACWLQQQGKTLDMQYPYDQMQQFLRISCLKIQQWRSKGASEDDIISRLRTRTVPPGYPIHPWKKGYLVILKSL